MKQFKDILLTALAPIIWGSTYLVTTELLAEHHPVTIALLRALPAGLLMLLLVRQLPTGTWWGKIFILGALNFSIFLVLLFITAYRLPGGIAATLGATQPLIVIFLAYKMLESPLNIKIISAALLGFIGVALLILSPEKHLDPIGIIAGLGGAISMALGIVLTRKWQPPVPLLTFTAWQLTAGGILLIPVVIWIEPSIPHFTQANLVGITWLSLIGAAVAYFLWFRGISRIAINTLSTLGFLSPATAVILGWIALEQHLNPTQLLGLLIVFSSIWASQRSTNQS
ncbi:MAG: EamA family transporter [Arenicella sp.]